MEVKSNLTDFCRLCLIELKQLELSSISPNSELKYSEILFDLIATNDLDLIQNDIINFPQGICIECALKLCSFYKFKTNIKRCQKKLLEIYVKQIDNYGCEANSSAVIKFENKNEDLEKDIVNNELCQAIVEKEIKKIENTIDDNDDDDIIEEINYEIIDQNVEEEIYNPTEYPNYEIINPVNYIVTFKDDEFHEIKHQNQLIDTDNKGDESNDSNENIDILYEQLNECYTNVEDTASDNQNKLKKKIKIEQIEPKSRRIFTDFDIPQDEQIKWQQKLSKWILKTPKGRHKSDTVAAVPIVKQHVCEICEKNFSSKTAVIKHQTVHTLEKKFQCSLCQKTFTRLYHVKLHMKIHQGIKDYVCGCGKAFVKSSDLSRHKRVHSDEIKYKCSICDRGFKWKPSLETHINSHSSEKKFKCNCGKLYTSNSSLRKHQITNNHQK